MGVRPFERGFCSLLLLEQAASARSREMGLRELGGSYNQR